MNSFNISLGMPCKRMWPWLSVVQNSKFLTSFLGFMEQDRQAKLVLWKKQTLNLEKAISGTITIVRLPFY